MSRPKKRLLALMISPINFENLPPKKWIIFLKSLFNVRLSYVPKIWKISQIIMIHKPAKQSPRSIAIPFNQPHVSFI